MKSGLYACAGASATARAAACAKRFDEPMTKRSKVYFGFNSTSVLSLAGITSGRATLEGGGCGASITGSGAGDERTTGRSLTAKLTTLASTPVSAAARE